MKIQITLNGAGEWKWRELFDFTNMVVSFSGPFRSKESALKDAKQVANKRREYELKSKIIHQEELDV